MSRRRARSKDLLMRFEGNPIICMDDLDFQCLDVRNAGVARLGGEVILLVTIEHLSGMQCLFRARQAGRRHWRLDPEPLMTPSDDPRYRQHEREGIMDPRITFLEGYYYIFYLAYGKHGYRLGLARTADFESVERLGLVSEPDTKGGALFSEKVKGRYARVERPGEGRSVWVSYSDDLVHWGGTDRIISPRDGYWDYHWVGPGAPPMAVDEGWLLIYYGAKQTSAGPIYRLGAVLLDREEPTHVVGRTNIPILSPRERYERIGDLTNIVFTCGALLEDDGTVTVYYGAADSCICVGTTTAEEIVNRCVAGKEAF
ncbi:MAG: glycoside hydrolase family 130 protein [Planctomycetota bacterium]|jgi:predicted GH43/DUF377 family glycosyl hydrolase